MDGPESSQEDQTDVDDVQETLSKVSENKKPFVEVDAGTVKGVEEVAEGIMDMIRGLHPAVRKVLDSKYLPSQPSQPQFSGYLTEAPRLPVFSGSSPRKGAEVTYSHWKFELESIIDSNSWSDTTILQAIRKSLRGMALDTLHNLGKHGDIHLDNI